MSDDKINKYFNVKSKYQEHYNKQRNKLKDDGNLSSTEIHTALLKFSDSRKCSECSKLGGISFEETKYSLAAKCLAEKPCFSINIKRRVVSDLWESYRTNKSVLNELDKSIIIMKYRSQNYIPLEEVNVKKSTQYNSSRNTIKENVKNTINKDTPYSIEMNSVTRNFIGIEKMRDKEKKIENNIEIIIDKLKNNNAPEIAEIELGISEMYDTLREFQNDDISTIKKQIKFNKEQQLNYDMLRPLKYAYFAVEEDDGIPPEFSLITRIYSTQQCEYNLT